MVPVVVADKDKQADRVKSLAKKLYIEMPIVRFDRIAAQTGIDIDIIRGWAQSELWLRQRTVQKESAKKKLETVIQSQYAVDLTTVKMCDALIEKMRSDLKNGDCKSEEVPRLLKSLSEATELRVKARDRLVRRG